MTVDSKTPLEYEAARRLCAAIIEQAVLDYRELVASGLVANGALTARTLARFDCVGYTAASEVAELVYFLAGRGLDELIALAGFNNISPDAIRSKLKIQPSNH